MVTGSEHRGGHVEQLRVEHADREEAVVLSAHGEVDGTNAPVLHEGLTAAFAAAAARTVPVVVDLTDVPFFASSGMALLVEHHKLGARRATPLRVVAPARSPLRALRAARLDQVLDLYPDLPAALAG